MLAVAGVAVGLGTVPSASAVPGRAFHGSVSVVKNGDGRGTVTSSPGGIDCGGSCSFSFVSTDDPANYEPVSLSASAEPGSSFEGFGGACSGDSCTIDPIRRNASYTVTATFDRARPSQFQLSVGINGQGRVTSAPAGIDCSQACSASFATDSTVALTAVPTPGWAFAGWSGACTGSGPCSVQMSDPRSVTATFAPPETVFTLAVATAGGDVVSDILGIACGQTCVATYGIGVDVTLTPVGGPVTWGGACTGSQSCIVSMTRARAVTATFGSASLANVPVAVSVSGRGTVTSSAGGISCGEACGAVVPAGSSLTLRAAAEPGWIFAGWSESCRGVSLTCTVAPRAATTVFATFVEVGTTYPIAVTRVGQGTITSRPAGIACGGRCAAAFGAGTTVTLEAEPRKGWTFVRWSGACTGPKPACAVGLDGPKSVSATFGRPSDRAAPRVKALPTTGTRGSTVRLRYRVTDASGRSRETAMVYAGRTRLSTIRGPEHALDPDVLYYVLLWRNAAASATRFCVTSVDPTGNVSRPSCTQLRIS